jgi:hypothetical protein
MPGHPRRSIVRLALATILAITFVGGSAAMPTPTAAALSRWTGGIDLYRSGVFTTQKTWLWCTAADVQIIRNIVDHQTDHTRANQQRYFDYMRAHDRYAIPISDGTDPGGWAAGLRHYVDSRYRVVASTSFNSALRSAVTNLRKTNRPVAVTVQHGNHGWVLTGFTATADPAVTTHFTVTSVHVVGPLWGLQDSSYGYDMRPDRSLTPSQFRTFFTPWHYARIRMAWEGDWVSIQAVPTSSATAPVARASTATTATPQPTAKATSTPMPTQTPTPSATSAPSGTPEPTPAAVAAAVAEPISSAPPAVALASGATSSGAGWDPWALLALAAAVLLVLAAAILGRPGGNTRVRASARARTGGTAPHQRS